MRAMRAKLSKNDTPATIKTMDFLSFPQCSFPYLAEVLKIQIEYYYKNETLSSGALNVKAYFSLYMFSLRQYESSDKKLPVKNALPTSLKTNLSQLPAKRRSFTIIKASSIVCRYRLSEKLISN